MQVTRTTRDNWREIMTKVRAHIAVSVDGYAAGPHESMEHPLGKGGEALHAWATRLEIFQRMHGREGGVIDESTAVISETLDNVGAEIMGRGKFGPPQRGPWAGNDWQGWWGDDPPFHIPVFVLTHHAREPLTLADTTFTFVTDGIESALAQAKQAAGEKDVRVGGGAATINQYLAAGLLDELEIHIAPVVLGGGARLFADVPSTVNLEQVRAVQAPGVTHIKYRVVR
jgi:dihydrofolate reductase